jgi:broad specificity phosphatase PhoE
MDSEMNKLSKRGSIFIERWPKLPVSTRAEIISDALWVFLLLAIPEAIYPKQYSACYPYMAIDYWVTSEMFGGLLSCGGASLDLVLIRHGESTANTNRVFSSTGWQHELTETGIVQAKAAAVALPSFFQYPSRIYSSGLRRAYETAAIISSHIEIEHRVLPELAEISMGILDGKSDKNSWDIHNAVWNRWFLLGDIEAKVPEGESFEEAIIRFKSLLSRLEEEEGEDARLILVGHGGMMLAVLLNMVYDVPEFIPRRGFLANCDMVHVHMKGNMIRFLNFKGGKAKPAAK